MYIGKSTGPMFFLGVLDALFLFVADPYVFDKSTADNRPGGTVSPLGDGFDSDLCEKVITGEDLSEEVALCFFLLRVGGGVGEFFPAPFS